MNQPTDGQMEVIKLLALPWRILEILRLGKGEMITTADLADELGASQADVQATCERLASEGKIFNQPTP